MAQIRFLIILFSLSLVFFFIACDEDGTPQSVDELITGGGTPIEQLVFSDPDRETGSCPEGFKALKTGDICGEVDYSNTTPFGGYLFARFGGKSAEEMAQEEAKKVCHQNWQGCDPYKGSECLCEPEIKTKPVGTDGIILELVKCYCKVCVKFKD